MQFSREKAKYAQSREISTIQPKEILSTSTKAKITITNYLGGQYFFTVDEVIIQNNTIYLIESKHSKNAIIPSISDIKDGLLKMILYSNLSDVEVDGIKMKSKAILRLTSPKISNDTEVKLLLKKNSPQLELIDKLFKEANKNNFSVQINYVK
jgi:hypothetical protein